MVVNQLELVHGFCYLGSHVEADDAEVGLHRRVVITRDCMSSLQRGIWKFASAWTQSSACSRCTYYIFLCTALKLEHSPD